MSELIADPCTSEASPHPTIEAHPARRASLGALEIRRALPLRERRLVGPWCFLDRYGPLTFTDAKPMDLGAHPHIGLETVSYLFDGEIVHHDSLGNEALLRPNEVNLMTAGRGIAHAEETPRKNSGSLSGVQLWIAMRESERNDRPAFAHRTWLEEFDAGGGSMTIAYDGGDHVLADLRVHGTAEFSIDLDFEHALFPIDGSAELEGQRLEPDVLYYIGVGRRDLTLKSPDARVLMIGGVPFRETILMWWNFVARTNEEIVEAREAWARHERFPEVRGAMAPRVDAPPLRGIAKPPAAS